jgi:hypothetical protein
MVVTAALTGVRARWDADKQPIGSYVLETYYDLSLLTDPLVPGPDLQASWSKCWAQLERAEALTNVDELRAAWLRAVVLGDLVTANEPRFARQRGYPSEFVGRGDFLIRTLQAYLSAASSPTSESEYVERIEFLDSAQHLLGRVANAFPTLASRAERPERRCRKILAAMESAKEKKYPKESDDEIREEDRSGDFNIVAIFNDL